MAEEIGGALGDGQTQAMPLGPGARRIAELMEFLENRCKLFFRDAAAGIPHLEALQRSAPPAADEHSAVVGVADRVRHQITQDALQQRGITPQGDSRWHDAQVETLRARHADEVNVEALQQNADRDRAALDLNRRHLELEQVEQCIEQFDHRIKRSLQLRHHLPQWRVAEARVQHPQDQTMAWSG